MVDARRPWDPDPAAANTAPEPDGERASRRGVLRGAAVAAGALTTGALTARGAMGRTSDTAHRPSFPHAFHSVSVVVPNIDRAIRFYGRVLGATVLMPRTNVVRGSHGGQRLEAMTGGKVSRGATACLSLANGVGIELIEHRAPADDGPRLAGPVHIAVTDPNVYAFVAEVEALGGARLGRVIEVRDGADYQRAFVRDPFGVTLEVVSVSVEQALANLG